MSEGAGSAVEAFSAPRRVGFCFHPSLPGARALAERLAAVAGEGGVEAWLAPLSWSEVDVRLATRVPSTDLLVCVGGDGTVLHASGLAAGTGATVLAVRMGRLGFLSECTEAEAEPVLRRALAGEGRVEQRTMVQAQVDDHEPVHALNDVVIGRRGVGRTIALGAWVDGVMLAEYRADAVIVASATGSTGYALSVGGPILHPLSRDLVLLPVAPHLTKANPLVLSGDARLTLTVERGFDAVLSVDGAQERAVEAAARVEVSRSPRTVRFLRLGERSRFYDNLAERLGWLRPDHELGGRAASSAT